MEKLKKVLIITYYWPPAGGPGVQRWLKLAKYMPENGIEPIILTVDPKLASYPICDESLVMETQGIQVYKTKTREIYNTYKRFTGKKDIPVGGGSDDTSTSFVKKIPNFIRGNFFIPDPRVGWKKYAVKKATELIKQYDIDTIITTSPPHSTQLIGLELQANTGVKWIADFRDPWTDIYFYNKFLRTKLAKWLDARLEVQVLEKADKVFTAGKGFINNFKSKSKAIDGSKFLSVNNGYDPSDFKVREGIKRDGIFTITYTGKINSLHNIEALAQAIKRLLLENPSEKVRLRFVGGMNEDVVALFLKYNIEEVLEYIPYVPHHVSIDYLFASDMQMLVIPNSTEVGSKIVNAKLFEYLASKKPILVLGPRESEINVILQETHTGQIFDYTDVDGVYRFIASVFCQKYNFNPDTKAIERYSRNSIAKEICDYLL